MLNKERNVSLTLSEEDLISIIFAAAQSSCAFDQKQIEHNLWHLHCCDYNEPLYKAVKQIDLESIKDTDTKDFLEKLLLQGKEDSEWLESQRDKNE